MDKKRKFKIFKPKFKIGQILYKLKFANYKPNVSIVFFHVLSVRIINRDFSYLSHDYEPINENNLFATKQEAIEQLENIISELKKQS